MPSYNLRRFSSPDAIKSIGREHLIALLGPHSDYLAGRGVRLPSLAEQDGLDYEGLSQALINPDYDTPRELANALYLIHETATPEVMNELLEEADERGTSLENGQDTTPADVAIQVWLKDREILERKHAESQLPKKCRRFEYFQTKVSPVPKFEMPSQEVLEALEHDLDEWFMSRKRGNGTRVFAFAREDGVWFLVRHGDAFKRVGSMENGRPSGVFFRPEKHDVLVYDPALGELRVHTETKGEKDLYRRKFGLHLFGSEEFFPGTAKYDLEPLRRDGESALACTDVEGMEWAKLKEVHYLWHSPVKEVEVRKADNIFESLYARGRTMPSHPRIIGASFHVKFADSRKPRTVTLRPSNIAQYMRDDDSVIIEEWLSKRGFIKNGAESAHAEACRVLAFP